MMKASHYILVLFLSLMSVSFLEIKAQQVDEDAQIIEKYFKNLNSEQLLNDLVNFNNEVNNTLNVFNTSKLSVLQNGDYNLIHVKSSINKLSIGQVGDYNSYEFLSYFSRDDLNLEVQQLGSNNSIQILGENSLINNMKIIQKSNYKNITITNY